MPRVVSDKQAILILSLLIIPLSAGMGMGWARLSQMEAKIAALQNSRPEDLRPDITRLEAKLAEIETRPAEAPRKHSSVNPETEEKLAAALLENGRIKLFLAARNLKESLDEPESFAFYLSSLESSEAATPEIKEKLAALKTLLPFKTVPMLETGLAGLEKKESENNYVSKLKDLGIVKITRLENSKVTAAKEALLKGDLEAAEREAAKTGEDALSWTKESAKRREAGKLAAEILALAGKNL